MSVRGRRPIGTTGWWSSACTRRSSRSSTTSTACDARPRCGDRLPRSGGQRLCDLGALQQPLLAGALFHRSRRPDPRPPLRRRPLRAIRARDPVADRHRARAHPVEGPASRQRPTGTPPHARNVSRIRPQRKLRVVGRSRAHEATATAPRAPGPNEWGLAGNWTIGRERVALDQPGGSIAYRFHARDAHLVLARIASRSTSASSSTESRLAPSHGLDSTRTETACSATAACISSIRHTTPSATGCLRSVRRAWRRGVRVHIRIADRGAAEHIPGHTGVKTW